MHLILRIAAGLPLFLSGCGDQSPASYLTWTSEDTGHSMAVVVLPQESLERVIVHYDSVSRGGRLEAYARMQNADKEESPGLGRSRFVAELSGLAPNQVYYYSVSDGSEVFISERSFRTLPEGDEPIRFLIGGDLHGDLNGPVEAVARTDPSLVFVGGDLVGDARPLDVDRWDHFFRVWGEKMVSPAGTQIPIVAAIGNHDVSEGNGAALFFTYLPQAGQRTYFARKLGSGAVAFVLDSGIMASHGGEQSNWLARALADTSSVPLRIAVYHEGLYPSVRPFDGEAAVLGRKYWAPLFDQFGLEAVFEHHDHALKRTWPLKAGAVDGAGTVYFGDGGWGRDPRAPDPSLWYLSHSAEKRHFWAVEINGEVALAQALGPDGAILDQYQFGGPMSE
jgi:acid phosphatase type 7